MTTPAHNFLSALQAALCACTVYGSDHASFSRQCDAAAGAAGAAMADHKQLTFIFLADRVICNDHALPYRPAEFEQVAARLGAHDANSLTFSAPPNSGAVRELITYLASPPGGASPTLPHMTLGHAHAAQPHETTPAPEPSLLTSQVQTLWGEVLQPDAPSASIGTDQLTQLILHIASGVAASRTSILRLATVKDMDEYTFVHTVNVAIQAAALAEAIGLSNPHVHAIIEAGLLHDIGKAAVPGHILHKKAMLTDGERAVVQQHPVDGAAMLVERKCANHIAVIVAYEHHMHIDGSGYPTPRAGHRPHLASQIVQLADVFDALRTHRPYRAALTHDEAAAVMWKAVGTKFDRDLLTTFFASVAPRAAAA